MQIPTGAIGVIVMIAAIFVTNKIKIRFIVILFLIVPVIGGAVGLIYLPRNNLAGLIGCYYTVYLIQTLRELTYECPVAWCNMTLCWRGRTIDVRVGESECGWNN
jgi:hypothetical protein